MKYIPVDICANCPYACDDTTINGKPFCNHPDMQPGTFVDPNTIHPNCPLKNIPEADGTFKIKACKDCGEKLFMIDEMRQESICWRCRLVQSTDPIQRQRDEEFIKMRDKMGGYC